jgi:hypothetical protein
MGILDDEPPRLSDRGCYAEWRIDFLAYFQWNNIAAYDLLAAADDEQWVIPEYTKAETRAAMLQVTAALTAALPPDLRALMGSNPARAIPTEVWKELKKRLT